MNGHAGIDTIEATEHLKNILNVGKSETESGKVNSVSNGKMDASGDSSLVLNNRPYQKIELHSSKDSSHISIYGNEVDIYCSPIEYGASSSQVIVEDMVDYGWQEKYYYGKIISIHLSGKYLAYVLKPQSKPGYVRILKINLDLRYLIKEYKNEVKDIAFAHTVSQVYLGSVDACGELFVHEIIDDGTSLICNLLLRILRPSDWIPSEHNRIIWCMYIPDDSDNIDDETNIEDLASLSAEDLTSILVVTHNERAEIWNIQTVIKEHGRGKLTIDNVNVGVQVISEHKKPITAATFSPDATALAIGSLDGGVKFFQVNTLEKNISPRCLHQWTPHPEKSLSSLYFLDNHKNHRAEMQFWKYAVTGAENNTELKIWSCETWECLQTIRLHPHADDSIQPCLKAETDLSSKYLFLTDIRRKALLIFFIQQDTLASNAFIRSVSEYKVPLPVLSLAVGSISYNKLHLGVDGKSSDDEEDRDQIGDAFNEEEKLAYSKIIKLFWIQTKSLQLCRIMYKPKVESPLLSVGSVSSLSQDSFVYKDGLSDISLDARDTSSRSGKELDITLPKGICSDELSDSAQSTPAALAALPSHISNFSNCTEVLLTPDDFTSPSHLSTQNFQDVSNAKDSTHMTDAIDSLPVEGNALQRRKSSQHSATSSPSREVAEILAPTKVLHHDEMADENEILNVKENVETLNNTLTSYNISSGAVSSRNKLDIKQDYHVKEWPQAPHTNKEYLASSRNESESASHNQNFHLASNESSVTTFEMNINRSFVQLNQTLNTLAQSVESLKNVNEVQRCEIQSLHNEIKQLRQEHKHVQSNMNLTKLDQVIAQIVRSEYSRLENLLLRTAEENRQRSDKAKTLMSEEISSNFGNRLETTLKQELTNCIVPQINKVLDTIGQKMQIDFAQKMTVTDAALKECISRNMKGKVFLDSFVQNVSASLQIQIQSTCKEVFQSSVIPAFDKTCQHLFQQLNETFSRGTKEYTQALERQGQSSCASLENMAAVLKDEMKSIVSKTQETLNSTVVKLENNNSELIKQQDVILSEIRQTIHEEVKKAFKDQTTSVLNSRSVTPVPQTDFFLQKQRITQFLKQGSIEEAFQHALSAMDVQLVVYLCENVNPDQVFGVTPCPLQQHVLLSLLNQLSNELTVKTEIKIKYIEDVIASLDSNNHIIKEHISSVIENLQQKISTFMQRQPNHKLYRNLKRISLAAQSLTTNLNK